MRRRSRKRWLARGNHSGGEPEQQAAAWVRGMFGRVAPRYDLVNHLLSINIDRYWRARTVSRVAEILARPERAGPGCLLRHGRFDAWH